MDYVLACSGAAAARPPPQCASPSWPSSGRSSSPPPPPPPLPLREPVVSAWPAWPSGPWDVDVLDQGVVAVQAVQAPPMRLARPSALLWQAVQAVPVEGLCLYPEADAGDVGDPFPYGPDASLATYATYQYQLQADGLLPADSFTQPPPEYPLYNWTLPYGPDRADSEVVQVEDSPSPSPAPTPTCTPTCTPPEPPDVYQQDVFDGDVIEVEVRSCRPGDADDAGLSERVTFDSIEEALASIEEQDADSATRNESVSSASASPRPAEGEGQRVPAGGTEGVEGVAVSPLLADERQDEVVKAAKSLFSKRTRTLYHWLYPDTSKTKLKATVSAAWDTLADAEKQFYLSQVLGRFGLQASSLMVNPQLDGIKGLPAPELGSAWTGSVSAAAAPAPAPAKHPAGCSVLGPRRAPGPSSEPPASGPKLSEAEQAVNQLFASCADSETWTSYSMSASASASALRASAPEGPVDSGPAATTLSDPAKKRKRSTAYVVDAGRNARTRMGEEDDDEEEEEEVTILKHIRDRRLEPELGEDAELRFHSGKLRQVNNGRGSGSASRRCRDGDDLWRGTPDPNDIFPNFDL